MRQIDDPLFELIPHIVPHDLRRGALRELAHSQAGTSTFGLANPSVVATAGHTHRAKFTGLTDDYECDVPVLRINFIQWWEGGLI